jgi:cobalt/nickel transport system permease protein
MADVLRIELPLWQLPLFFLILLFLLVVVLIWLGRMARKRVLPREEPDWAVPPVADAVVASPLRCWDVRCKIITIVVYCFFIAALQHLIPALIAVVISFLVLVVSKSSLLKVLMRLLAVAGFVCMFLVIMPLSVPEHSGDTMIVFHGLPWLGFNLRGLRLAATIAAKAVAITMLMEPLLSTAPLPVTLHGLSRLGVPEMVGQMILLSYRYLHVFRHEARRMASGMQVRGFRKRTDPATFRAIANFLGMLFVRSFERTERVFDAMRARGYTGRLPEPAELHLHGRDLVWGGIGLIAGGILVFYDRLVW